MAMTMMRVMTDKMMFDDIDQGVAYDDDDDDAYVCTLFSRSYWV